MFVFCPLSAFVDLCTSRGSNEYFCFLQELPVVCVLFLFFDVDTTRTESLQCILHLSPQMNHAITWHTSPTAPGCKLCCQQCISMWVACALRGSHMFTVNLLDESQVCSCSLGIIHRSPFYPGGATGSWWSGSAKTPNWRRRSAAAGSQRGQMPLLMYHVFQAGQQCVCVWAGVGGERTERLPRHSHIDANLTHAWVLPTVCVTISASLTDLWGVPSSPFPLFLRCSPLPRWELAPACGHPAHQWQDPFRWSLLNDVLAAGHCSRMPASTYYR